MVATADRLDRFSGARIILLVTMALCWLADIAPAQTPTVRIPRVAHPPTLEDFLNDRPRAAEVRITDFRQREPGDGVPVSQETSTYLSYDDKNFYAVFVCKDDPRKVRARLTKREGIGGDDVVGIILDTFYDRRRAYIFLTNPLGIQLDGIVTNGQDDDYSFDTLWYSEGRLTPDGYVVWMAIPFKSLRFSNAPVQTWGIAVGRIIVRNNETAFWPYITRRVEGFVQQMATLEGLEQISPGRNLQFIPYGAFSHAHFLDTQVPEFRTKTTYRAGLDAKAVLRDALTLDIALNPDFSQVESDEPQVTVNQRFEVLFPEKRPFFIENSGFFQTPENLFFSRRIVDPQFGARLTGKLGRWALGGLVMDDRAPGQRVAETDRAHGRRAGIGVLRVQRELANQSSIGGLVTSRDFASSSDRVFSLDTRLKLNPNWVFNGQWMRGFAHQLDGKRFAGPAYFAELRRSGRKFNYSVSYVDRSPTFRGPDVRSQLGYIPRVDVRKIENFADYSWRREQGRVVRFGPSASALVNWDRRGRVQDWSVRPGFAVELKGPTVLAITRAMAFELYQDHGFRKDTTILEFTTARLKWLEVSAVYRQGTNINFFPAAGLAPFLANATDGQFGLTVRPTSQVRIDQTYLINRLVTRAGSTPPGTPVSASIYNNHILRSKFNYQVSRALSLRAILDYNTILPNSALVDQTREKRLTGDFLVTYLINPGTAFYIGYTDRYDNLAIDLIPTPTLRRIASPQTSSGRQFFIKLSYLFRF